MAIGTPSSLLSSGSSTDLTTYTTASVSPSADTTLVLFVNGGLSGVAAAPTSVSGLSLTWTKRTDQTTNNGNINGSIWTAKTGSSPGSGTISITFGATQENASWKLIEATGANPSTTNFIDGSSSSTTPSVTLPSSPASTSAVLAFINYNAANTNTITAAAGFTKVGTDLDTPGTPQALLSAAYDLTTPGTGSSWTTSNASNKTLHAIELTEASVDGSVTAPDATFTAQAHVPAVAGSGDADVATPDATFTAQAQVPTVVGGTDASRTAVAAEFTAQAVAPVVAGGTATDPITALTENFEGGTNGADVTEANTFFENVDPNNCVFTTNAIEGSLAMATPTATGSSVNRADLPTARTTLWVSFYFKVTVAPSTNTQILAVWGNSGANKVGDLRLTPTNQIQLRSQNSEVWTGTSLTTNAWHRIAVGVTVGSSIQVKIYSGTNLHSSTTPSQQSGVQSNSNTTATNISDIRLGRLSSDATDQHIFDRIRGDGVAEPAPMVTSTDAVVTPPRATFTATAKYPTGITETTRIGDGPATASFVARVPTVSGGGNVTVAAVDATFAVLTTVPVVDVGVGVFGVGRAVSALPTASAEGQLRVYGEAAVRAPLPTTSAELTSTTVLYSPPVYEVPMQSRERILTFYRLTWSDSIVFENGAWTTIRDLTPERVAGLVEGVDWFKGGGVYNVTASVKAALAAAGYPSSV